MAENLVWEEYWQTLWPIKEIIKELGFNCMFAHYSLESNKLESIKMVRVILSPERSAFVTEIDANTLGVIHTTFKKLGSLSGETKAVGNQFRIDLHDPDSPQQLADLLRR